MACRVACLQCTGPKKTEIYHTTAGLKFTQKPVGECFSLCLVVGEFGLDLVVQRLLTGLQLEMVDR